MSKRTVFVFFTFVIWASAALASGPETAGPKQVDAMPPLDVKIDHFDVDNAIMRGGLSELSLKDVKGLHLGFEEIILEKIQDDPRTQSPHFSLHMVGKTVREVLDELCSADSRYVWSTDGATINVYPRASAQAASYLLDLWISQIQLKDIPDPDQGLVPLSKQFPAQQVGYSGSALGDDRYTKPWTVAFEHLTVRQFINRLAEHMGTQTSWVWRGGENERLFTFLKGGFYTGWPTENTSK
jgi:hypothetical protein